MISKIITVRPGRISGWCLDPSDPKKPLSVDLLVNGKKIAVMPCNRLRRELDPARFPNRVIGFVGQLPLAFWTGDTVSVMLSLSETGEILDQRELNTRDVRIPDSPGVFGELTGFSGGRMMGWAVSEIGPVSLDLAIDGQPFARSTANEEVSGDLPSDSGFSIWLPDDIYDGKSHRLVLTVRLPDGTHRSFAVLDQEFAPQEARHLSGTVTDFSDGQLTGQVQIVGWPSEPVTLVAEAAGVEIARTESLPSKEGAFTLDLRTVEGFVLGRDRLDIYDEFTGLVPEFLAENLVARFLKAVVRQEATLLDVALISPVSLGASQPVTLQASTPDGPTALSLVLTSSTGQMQLQGQIALADIPPAASALQFCIGSDIIIDLPPLAQAESSAEHSGPAFTGDWTLLPGGIVRGWIRNMVAPDQPGTVALCVNQVEVMSAMAETPVLLPTESGARLPAACGFSFDLSKLGRNSGVAQLSVVGPDGFDLPSSGSTRQRFPVSQAAVLLQPGALYGMSAYPVVSAEAAQLYCSPLKDGLAALLAKIFGGPRKESTVAAGLVAGLLALAKDKALLQVLRRPGFHLDPARWNPLTCPSATEIAAALPLSEAGQGALREVLDWRGLLRLLLLDDLLFPAILSQDDWGQMWALHILRQTQRPEIATAPILLSFGSDPAIADMQVAQSLNLPEALSTASKIAVIDAEGRPFLQFADPAGVYLPEALRARLRDPAAALQPGWCLLALQPNGVAQNWRLVWQDQRREPAARVHENITLTDFSVTPRHASVSLTGHDLHRRVVLRLGGQKAVILQACPPSSTEAGSDDILTRRYAAVLPVWALETDSAELHYKNAPAKMTFDLRLGEEDGRRPIGLPQFLRDVVQPGALLHSPVALERGQLTGWAFDQAEEPGSLRLALIETVPPSPEQLERRPDAQPTDLVLVQASADMASSEAEMLHAVKNCGYALALHSRVLDGLPHALRLIIRRNSPEGAPEYVLWQEPEFTASDADLLRHISSCPAAPDLHRLLLALAKVRRFAVLDAFFRHPRSLSSVEMTMEQTFEVLCTAAVQGGTVAPYHDLERLFASLWAIAAQDEKRSASFVVIAAKAALQSSPLPPDRYPHAPTVEAVVDLVLTAPLEKASAAIFANLASACTQGRRHQLALSLLRRGLAIHSKDSGLLTQLSGVHLALGDHTAGEKAAISALAEKPRSPAALLALARTYARQGRPLHAASALTGGKGLSSWIGKAPTYDHSKCFAGMDWVGIMRDAAISSDHATMQASIARSELVLGMGDRPEDCGLTVVLPEAKPGSGPAIFDQLAPVGCLQIITDAEDRISEIDCIGRWALILSAADSPKANLVSAIFAQLRPHETVARLVRGAVDDKGVPTGFSTVGAVIRSDALRAFGPVSLQTYLTRAATVLRVKTILM